MPLSLQCKYLEGDNFTFVGSICSWNFVLSILISPSLSISLTDTHMHKKLFGLIMLAYCVVICNSSVQFSHSVMSDTSWPQGPQHARPPCPSPTPGVHPNPCPSSRWCHPSNHLILCCPLLLLPSIFASIRVFSSESSLHIRWPMYWSFSFNISPSNEHSGLLSLGWTGCISLQSKGLSRVFSNTTVQKHQFFGT